MKKDLALILFGLAGAHAAQSLGCGGNVVVDRASGHGGGGSGAGGQGSHGSHSCGSGAGSVTYGCSAHACSIIECAATTFACGFGCSATFGCSNVTCATIITSCSVGCNFMCTSPICGVSCSVIGCTDPGQQASFVQEQAVGSNPPPPFGGTIVDNTYWSTSFTVYTGPNGPSGPLPVKFRATLSISGGTYALDWDVSNNGGVSHTVESGTITVGSPKVILTPTCTGGASKGYTYSVKGGVLIVYVPSANGQMQEIVFNSIGGL